MNNRLMKFLEISQLIEVNQIGFIPGKRTTDHIFVLKTLIDLAKQKRKPLYPAMNLSATETYKLMYYIKKSVKK